MTKEICEVAIQQANAPDLKGRLPLDLGLLPEAVRNQLGGMRELTGFSSNSGVVWCNPCKYWAATKGWTVYHPCGG